MVGILSAPRAYVSDLSRSTVAGWNRFFFTPADPLPLGLMRIGLGLLLFWKIAILGIDLREFLGSDGWVGPEAIRQYLAENAPRAWSIWFLVSDRWLFVAWIGCLVVAALFTAGFASRLTSLLAWAIVVSIDRRAPAISFGFDHMIATWLFYLAVFGASGQSLSIDSFLLRRRARQSPRNLNGRTPSRDQSPVKAMPSDSVSANLTARLIQLHLALVYGSAGLAKLIGPEWWDGTALEMIILTPEFKRWDLSGMLAYPLVLNFATHAGLAIEISYPVFIWNRKLRPLLLLSIASVHFGIDMLLGLTEFGLTMIVANLAFVSGAWLRSPRLNDSRDSVKPALAADAVGTKPRGPSRTERRTSVIR